MLTQTITRKGSFDSMHRVMNEQYKCFHVHGHTYLYELTFEFETMEEIGYAIDFKEIKRIGVQWIEDFLDHGAILNPMDHIMIKASRDLKSKTWLMSLMGEGKYCNPSVENISRELFLAMELLFDSYKGLTINNIKIWETPNCCTDCTAESISNLERTNFRASNETLIHAYAKDKGILEYDDRKTKK